MTEENENDPALQWLRLINAETEDDLNMLENSNIPEIKDAVEVVKFFSGDEQIRLDAFEREMAIRDHLASIAAERQDGYSAGFEDGREEERQKYAEEKRKYEEEIKNHVEEKQMYEAERINNVLNMLSDNNSDDLIIRYTGVSSVELAEIKAKFNK